jgi:hypothetical protein
MRMMMRVTIPVAEGNKGIADGTLPKTMMGFIDKHKPEASYFVTYNGRRCGFFVFDLKDNAAVPSIAEPFFNKLNAEIDLQPAMNADDLRAGLERVSSAR